MKNHERVDNSIEALEYHDHPPEFKGKMPTAKPLADVVRAELL